VGATAVFADVDPMTFNLDPQAVVAAVTPRTRAIVVVHLFGLAAPMDELLEIARRHKLAIIEDAACAVGTTWRDRPVGAIGDIGCFSFHPRKVITTGDGGMITTARPEWDARFRLWRQHGMSVPDVVRHGAAEVTFETYDTLGFNYRLTDLQAAVGRVQLQRLPEILERRRRLASRYATLLASVPGLRLPTEPLWARTNWQSYCVRLPDGCDQRTVMQALLDQGIASKRGVMCTHRSPAYMSIPWSCDGQARSCSCAPGACARLSESEQAEDRSLMLPLYPGLSNADQDRVVQAVAVACGGAP
jgi:dTDP-4-amino-4,6-dideoxygalactose transaminase